VIRVQTERPCPHRIWTLAAGEVMTPSLPSIIKPPGAPQWKPRPSTLSQTPPRSLCLSLFTPRYWKLPPESIYRADYSDRPKLLKVHGEKPLVFIIILARLIEPDLTQSLAPSCSLSPVIARILRCVLVSVNLRQRRAHLQSQGEPALLMSHLLHRFVARSFIW
jgi:hypothetical protein